MERGVAPRAALALALLSLAAMPLALAESDPHPLQDETGPAIGGILVDPNPAVPDLVRVEGVATDGESPVTFAEFWIDTPGANATSFFRMRPADGAFDSPTETIRWTGPYFTFTQGIAPGFHDLLVHAIDLAGNWGPYASFTFFVGDPSNTGPTVSSLSAMPRDVPVGTSLLVDGVATDPFLGAVEAAEFFFDFQGRDGSGTPMESPGGWHGAQEDISGRSFAPLTPGAHVVYVHALNDRGLWGTLARASFIVRAPAMSFRLTVEPSEPRPGDIATYSVHAENHGNAEATEVWVDLAFPPVLAYLDNTSAASGGTATGPTSWRFSNPASTLDFEVRFQVRDDATDGVDLTAVGTLDFTNENGWNFSTVPATTTATVIAQELRLAVTAPPIVYAAETFDLSIDLIHTGIHAIPAVEVSLDIGGWATAVGDNAASFGGAFVDGLWRFWNLPPGAHTLVVTERVDADRVDQEVVRQGVSVRYLSRSESLFLQEEAEARIARPSLELSIRPSQLDARAGEPVSLDIDYANHGSAPARDIDLELTLPAGLFVAGGDAPHDSAGARQMWNLPSLAPDQSGRLTLVLEARAALAADLRFDLAYTGPGGQPLGRVTASASIAVAAWAAPPAPVSPTAAIAFVGASAILAAFLATERGKTALTFLLFVPLYTRLRHDKVLDHETRGMIRGYIVANPGDHYNSIKEALELPNGTLAYHIQVLQKELIVRSVKDGKFRRFYPAEMRVPEGGEPTKIQRVILELIRANPGITPRDAAGLLGLTSSTVSYHLEKLEEHGRIEYRREGITKRLYVRGDLGI